MGFFDSFKKVTGAKSAEPLQAPTPKKVLVVEDEEDLRTFYEDLLAAEGFLVLEASNGQEGLDTATAQKPDVIILDLMMPVMDGKTMLRKLRQIQGFESLPVIVLTNAGTADNMRETQFYDKACAFLIKANVNPQDIIDRVKALTR